MAEKWTMHGKVTCDLCLEEQDLPDGTVPKTGSDRQLGAYLPGWRVAGCGGAIDLCELCRDVPMGRVRAVCTGEADGELREELRRARRGGDWDNVRVLAPALRGGPREEADRILARRRILDWAEKADAAELVAAVPLHQTDRRMGGLNLDGATRAAPRDSYDHIVMYVRIHGVRHDRSSDMDEDDPEKSFLDGWYCGDGWCDGRCRYPALTLTRSGTTLRALGSQVACGPAWQPFRRPWTGSTVDVATIYNGDLDAVARLWWT